MMYETNHACMLVVDRTSKTNKSFLLEARECNLNNFREMYILNPNSLRYNNGHRTYYIDGYVMYNLPPGNIPRSVTPPSVCRKSLDLAWRPGYEASSSNELLSRTCEGCER